MNSEIKCLLIAAGVLVVVYLINRYSSKDTFANTQSINSSNSSNEEQQEQQEEQEEQEYEVEEFAGSVPKLNEIPKDTSNDSFSEVSSLSSIGMSDEEKKRLKTKYRSKNSAKLGKYKRVSYKDGRRGQDVEDIDKFFNDNNSLVKEGQLGNDSYEGRDETGDKYATYRAGPKKALTDEDIFKSENYLPKESNKDWFEVMPEPISIKNRHLINVSRPVGVNTIGNSLRNASYDLRGTPACPKFVVSPWMQSTIEPDYNIKGLC